MFKQVKNDYIKYLSYLQATGKIKQRTKESYLRLICDLPLGDHELVTVDILNNIFLSRLALIQNKYSYNKTLAAYRKFVMFLQDEKKMIVEDLKAQITGFQPLYKQYDTITFDSLKTIFEKMGNSLIERRNKMLLILFYETGAKLDEITSLLISDYSIYEKTIRINGQNGQRVMNLSEQAVSIINAYLQFSNNNANKNGYLIISDSGRRLSNRGVSLVLESYTYSGKPFSAEFFRRNKLLALYSEGQNITDIQYQMGYSNYMATYRAIHY